MSTISLTARLRTWVTRNRGSRKATFGGLALMSLILFLCIGCTTTQEPSPATKTPEARMQTPAAETYVAVSGGGWRTHTAQAAWTMGLLQAYRESSSNPTSVDLDTVFQPVSGISANSGGSWFTTMLAYSKEFRAALEVTGAIGAYGSTGYLGQQKATLNNRQCKVFGVTCGGAHTESCFECNVRSLTNNQYTVWTNIVDGVVFLPYGMRHRLATRPLDGTRETWANGKPLIFAATLLTDEVVANQDDCGLVYCNEIYYSLTKQIRPGVPQQVNVTPVAFSSIPTGSRYTPPDFLLAGDMQLKYASNASSGGPPSGAATVSNSALNSNVSVLTAAASSSAAAGAQASASVERYQGAKAPWTDAYNSSGLAPGFKIDHNTLMPTTATVDTQPQTLAKETFIRLADGGFLDNSAVAHVINFLQKNSAPSFNIIAFDNVQQHYKPPGLPATKVPVDIAYLFGKGPWNVPAANPTRFDPTVFCGGQFLFWNLCLRVPKQQIFESTPVETTVALWTHPCNGNELNYTKYTATTVDNPTLGITGGLSGSLHVFGAVFPKAATAPNADAVDWNTYQEMLECVYDGMANQGGADWYRGAFHASQ